MKCSIGLITAPRKESYVKRTIKSIQNSGWKDITVFAEPNSVIPDQCKVVQRNKIYGDWTNWVCGLFDLFINSPDSDYFAMFEDDVVLCNNSRNYVESLIPKMDPFGSISLYTPARYSRKKVGFHNFEKGWETFSTVTVIMSFEGVLSFLSDPEVLQHRKKDIMQPDDIYSKSPNESNTRKDGVIGRWARKNRLPIFYHSPSLAEHIGINSILTDRKSNIKNDRMSKDFVGENFDIKFLNPSIIRHKEELI